MNTSIDMSEVFSKTRYNKDIFLILPTHTPVAKLSQLLPERQNVKRDWKG
jgi:hypothetical protein